MKDQLTRAKNAKLKNFGYGAILTSFVLERIPLLTPQLILVDRGEHFMVWVVALMAQHGSDGSSVVWFTLAYFMCLRNQVFTIENFPYAGMVLHSNLSPSLESPVPHIGGIIL